MLTKSEIITDLSGPASCMQSDITRFMCIANVMVVTIFQEISGKQERAIKQTIFISKRLSYLLRLEWHREITSNIS